MMWKHVGEIINKNIVQQGGIKSYVDISLLNEGSEFFWDIYSLFS